MSRHADPSFLRLAGKGQLRNVSASRQVVVVLEFTAIAILATIAYAFHRPDLAPVFAATVVGLHFLPLGKIFWVGPLLFGGYRDNALVRCLRDFVPFQFARSVEQHRDGRSTLG